jgi:hypothetical protein
VRRICYDSTNINDIPQTAEMVAYYVDGKWAVQESVVRARFPSAVLVPIACLPGTNLGTVGDVETGDMLPWELVDFVIRRRAAGVDPTGYVNDSNWPATRTEFQLRNIPEPHWWEAKYDNVPILSPGSIAKQFANEPLTGGHFDMSIVADVWPGVNKPNPTPKEQLQEMVILLGPDGAQYLLCGKFFVHIPSVPESAALQAAGAKVATVSQAFIDAIKAETVTPGAGSALTKITLTGALS